MSMFQYDFMVRALIAGALLAIIIPSIGVVVVLRRLSMIGDALSHVSLAGVAIGLLLGFSPVLGAIVACIVAALGIESIRRKFPKYSELSIAIILSAGVGLAGVLSGKGTDGTSLSTYMFGSIIAITDLEMALILGSSVLVIFMVILLYKELFYICLDENAARLAGIPVKIVGSLFTILTALTVAVASRTVGALIVSSLMVLPVACAMQISRSYKKTVLYSVGFALFFTITGLVLSFYHDIRPGGTIVLTGVVVLLLILLGKEAGNRVLRERAHAGK